MDEELQQILALLGSGPAGGSGERPFLTGNMTQQSLASKSAGYVPMSGTYTQQVETPEQATPSAVLQTQYGPTTWAELPAHLKANDRKAYLQLMEDVKKTGYSSWEEVLDGASRTQKPIWDFIDEAKDSNAQFADPNAAGGGGPTSNVNTDTTLASESSAAGLADQAFQAELGRRADDGEVRQFQKALNAQQSANPLVTRSTNSGGPNSTSASQRTGGFDPTRFAQEWARSRPEYAEVQAATTFMDILDRAMSRPDALSQLIAGGN